MATTQFKPSEKKEVTLPSSHSLINLPDKGKIMVTVTEEDSVFVEYVEMKTEVIDGEEIKIPEYVDLSVFPTEVGGMVQQIRSQSPGNLKALLIIKADKNVRFGTMQEIMKSLQSFNLRTFQIVTEFETEVSET